MYLELNGDTLTLDEANGYLVQTFDLGYPSVRVVSDVRPLADGTDDLTQYFGERVVALDITMTGDKWARMDALGKYLAPYARPYLYYDDAAQARRIRLRPADRRLAIMSPTTSQQVLVQWVAPDGVSEAAAESSVTVFASPQDEPGFTFDLTFDIDFPTAPGRTQVTTDGNAKTYPTLRLYGPAVTPRIENAADLNVAGEPKRLTFDITVADGDYLEVDVRNRTVLLNGRADKSRYYTLDFTESEWWTLLPGLNQIRYFPVSYSGSTRAVILYRSTFL